MMAEFSDLDSMKSLEEPVFGFLSNEILILQILPATFLIHFFLSCILNGVKILSWKFRHNRGNIKLQTSFLILYSSKLSKKWKRDFKVREDCSSLFSANINSSLLIMNFTVLTSWRCEDLTWCGSWSGYTAFITWTGNSVIEAVTGGAFIVRVRPSLHRLKVWIIYLILLFHNGPLISYLNTNICIQQFSERGGSLLCWQILGAKI